MTNKLYKTSGLTVHTSHQPRSRQVWVPDPVRSVTPPNTPPIGGGNLSPQGGAIGGGFLRLEACTLNGLAGVVVVTRDNAGVVHRSPCLTGNFGVGG